MPVILAVLLLLLFFVSIALGTISYFEKTGKEGFYFTLSAIGLIGTTMMFVLFHWDLGVKISPGDPKSRVVNTIKQNRSTINKKYSTSCTERP